MIIGEYRSKISTKNRVAIPKKFRESLGGDFIITRGYERSLVIVNNSMWEKIAKEVIDGSFINKNIRDTTRFLVGSAVEAVPDSQGRVVIPSPLIDYADMKQSKELVFIGLINWIEVWSIENWKERLTYLDENSDEISKQLSDQINNG